MKTALILATLLACGSATNHTGKTQSGTPLDRRSRYFPFGEKIRYVIDNSLNGGNDQRVLDAIAEWEQKTCFRFTRCSGNCQAPYLQFVSGSGCSSPVGQSGRGANRIQLARGCGVGAAIHEIGHSLGLSHEQSRRDRDRYVTIDMSQVQSGVENNFQKNPAQGRDIGKYDYGSIMHYGSTAFARGRSPTIMAPEPIGQRDGLSSWDIRGIQFLYNNCNPSFSKPRCMPSMDDATTHYVSPSGTFIVDFNGLYEERGTMTVTYDGTDADVQWSGSTSIRDTGFVTARFSPTSSMNGQTFTISATFSGGGASETCSVKVTVGSNPNPAPAPGPSPPSPGGSRPGGRPPAPPAGRPWWQPAPAPGPAPRPQPGPAPRPPTGPAPAPGRPSGPAPAPGRPSGPAPGPAPAPAPAPRPAPRPWWLR